MAWVMQSPGWRRWLRSAFRHEAFARGTRLAVALVALMVLGWALDLPQVVMPLTLGVMASGLSETDDGWRGRLRALLVTLVCFAAMALAVQATLIHPLWMLVVVCTAAPALTLLGALGERYRAIAFATLILGLYTGLAQQGASGRLPLPVPAVALLMAGAAWYGVLSVAWAAAFPMLAVQHRMARLYELLGEYLKLKSRLFEPVRGVDLERRRIALALHNGKVVQALNDTKESLFSRLESRRAPATLPPWLSQGMHLYFVAQDLHEKASSSHDHYDVLVEAFFHSDVLYRCQRLLALTGQGCQDLGQAVASRDPWQEDVAVQRATEDLESAIAHVQSAGSAPSRDQPLRSLRSLASNLGRMTQVLADALTPGAETDLTLFDRRPGSWHEAWQRVRAQLSLGSALLRHGVRLSLALAAGFALMWATGDSHGYWILLTIVFVCQPQYGATLRRLSQRLVGTVAGLVVGWALLKLFPDVQLQSLFSIAAGVLFFVTRQTHYTLATAAVTSLVLLSFNQVGDGFGLIVPRLLDTLAGGGIAALAVWLVLPSWQSGQLPWAAAQALRSQAAYLREVMAQYAQGKKDHLAYRLARRNAHNADAALSGVLQAMFREPGRVRGNARAGMRFLALSHTLLSYLSAMGAHRHERWTLAEHDEVAQAAQCLEQALEALAQAFETRQIDALVAQPGEVACLQALQTPCDDASVPARRVLQAQLQLALRQLEPLREQARQVLLVRRRRLRQGETQGETGAVRTIPPAGGR